MSPQLRIIWFNDVSEDNYGTSRCDRKLLLVVGRVQVLESGYGMLASLFVISKRNLSCIVPE